MALNKVLQSMLNDFRNDHSFKSLGNSKAFEYMVNYLLVTKFDSGAFSDKGDIEDIVVDRKGQFGLDAIAFIVNGNLVLSKEDISVYAKSKRLDVDILFIQSKTVERCESGDLLKTIQATKNFLYNFSAVTEKNENIINAKNIFDELNKYDNYRYCTGSSPTCHIFYVTVADEFDAKLVENIISSAKKEINDVIKSVDIQVLGKDYIIDAYNEMKNNVPVEISLKNCITLEQINNVKEAYIGYLTGDDYIKIICDKNGDLRKRIFYENVRDYQGVTNNINKEIRETITDSNMRGQFVLLNNGVTIITSSVTPLGANKYELLNFQVVNGCQTSNEIFNCKKFASEIYVPVKIIYTTDRDITNHIVKASNRQTPVPEEAFITLDKYHKELQLLFSEYSKEMPLELFYERRSGEKDDITAKKGSYQVITLHGMIRAFESVYLQSPNMVHSMNPANILRSQSSRFFQKMHKQESYYIASYLFAKFVYMQQNGIFSHRDYRLRFYVIMAVRALMLKNPIVPKLDSKEIDIENKKIIDILKSDDVEKYFKEARKIVAGIFNERRKENYMYKKQRNRIDILRNANFCDKVKEALKIEIDKHE